jgi:tetratricopeptide (TPR) repeat protein
MYRGEFGQAEAVLRRILPARLEPDNATWRNAELVTPLLGLARLAEVKGDLLAARREAERALAIQPKVPLCLYFAGLFAIRAGDLPAGERHLRTLEEVVSVARGPLVPHYRHALAAEIALARGRPLEAQPLLENAVGSGKLFYDFWNVMPGDAFRDGLARSYLAVGDKEKAAEVLAALVSSRFDRDPLLSVRALYTLGKLKLELGDQVRGRELLRQFLEHWGKADWDLPEVREARALLASSGS